MSKDTTTTPRGQIRSVLVKLFTRSRERASALKNAKYTCACGAKQSKAKGKEVAIYCDNPNLDMEALIDIIVDKLLCRPELLQCVCATCKNK